MNAIHYLLSLSNLYPIRQVVADLRVEIGDQDRMTNQ
jgi:hypothetical protein